VKGHEDKLLVVVERFFSEHEIFARFVFDFSLPCKFSKIGNFI